MSGANKTEYRDIDGDKECAFCGSEDFSQNHPVNMGFYTCTNRASQADKADQPVELPPKDLAQRNKESYDEFCAWALKEGLVDDAYYLDAQYMWKRDKLALWEGWQAARANVRESGEVAMLRNALQYVKDHCGVKSDVVDRALATTQIEGEIS